MPLADELIKKAKDKILVLQAQANSQREVKLIFLNLLAMNPAGLKNFQRAWVDIEDFAEVIEVNRKELRPWVMVYGAAAGLEGPWSTVLNVWSRVDYPADPKTQINTVVVELLESLFAGYTRLIAT
jgi:hypothetical protein